MVPQEPAPLPVRPRLDFEAGPVTGATLATGQIPVIDPQPGQTVAAQPVESFEAEEEPEKRRPVPRQDDDAAWTASLRLPSADEAWAQAPREAGWNYPQIFDEPSPAFADEVHRQSPDPAAKGQTPASAAWGQPRTEAAPVRSRAEGVRGRSRAEAAPGRSDAEGARGRSRAEAAPGRSDAEGARGQSRTDAVPVRSRAEAARGQSRTDAVLAPSHIEATPVRSRVEASRIQSRTDTNLAQSRTQAASAQPSTWAAPTQAPSAATPITAPVPLIPVTPATPAGEIRSGGDQNPSIVSNAVNTTVDGPPTAPTTALPLRREVREQHSEPAPRRSRLSTALGVLKKALGRRETRPHRRGADPNTLGTRFSPRANHLGLMRLSLALVVGFTHAAVIGYGWQPMIGHAEIGELCVDAFFVLSGFLLVGSYLRLDSVRRYAWHRFLRIMPGFWVCLVVSATLLAPLIAWLQDQPMNTLLTGEDSAVDYVIRNASLLMRQWGISGLPTDVEMAGVLNGSLWTLFYEAACYASIIALGVCGGLRRRPVMTLGAVGALWVVTVLNDYQIMYIGQERILRLSFMFLIGSVLYLYAHQVPVNRLLTLAAGGVMVVGVLFFDDYRVIAGPAFGYVLMALAVSRVKLWEPRTDISYGLYVYHWPLLQILNIVGLAAFSLWVFVPVGMALSAVVALLSWKLVEKPALTFKDAGWVTWKLPVARPATSQA
ncbi:hypothetical protein Kisp01_07450 [Kineosporia sp. NBRC 101677]|uniref:acyltransferase family protein n=1 Tax=Kineosporia sp. NBRC 101677 TaxID=3032197 RepID=UPI0024A26517|nr:acyltransferase family protein [Kineosporia sp. NBRC 101677]GLY13729.1 hypothetical protein Kisp01_07450 [Kineosporia sp. NBRC 101677]